MSDSERLLEIVGARVRARRQRRGETLKALAASSGLSPRYLVELERGRGNISIARLAAVARALSLPLMALVAPPGLANRVEELAHSGTPDRLALLGVRGAGKSTVGRRIAHRLRMDFVELDALVEDAAGLTLAEIFAIHGETYYRDLEREALTALVDSGRRAVIATGGSLVTFPDTWQHLRANARTVWLRAEAQDLWDRVIAQGDHRPMESNPHAFAQLEALLARRIPLYEQADVTLDTRGRTVDAVVDELAGLMGTGAR